MTEKQIIEFTRFEIYRAKRAASAGSLMADYHQKEADVLSVLLEAYIRLNTLERESLRRAKKPLYELLQVSEEGAS